MPLAEFTQLTTFASKLLSFPTKEYKTDVPLIMEGSNLSMSEMSWPLLNLKCLVASSNPHIKPSHFSKSGFFCLQKIVELASLLSINTELGSSRPVR